jgi:hypothetical protein
MPPIMLPQLQDELLAAAGRPPRRWRTGARTTAAVCAAVLALLAAPAVTHARLTAATGAVAAQTQAR